MNSEYALWRIVFCLKEVSWKFISVPGTVKQLLGLIADSGCILVMGKALEDRFFVFKKEAYVRYYHHLYTRYFLFFCIQDILKFSFTLLSGSKENLLSFQFDS